MITNSAEKMYIAMDAQDNGIKSWGDYIVKLICDNVGTCVYRYLKTLRKYEYFYNTRNIMHIFY